MSSPHPAHMSDSEEEFIDIHVDPASLPRAVEEEYSSEEEEPEEDPEWVPDYPITVPASPAPLSASPPDIHHDFSPSLPTPHTLPSSPAHYTLSTVPHEGESSRGVTRPRSDEPPARATARIRVRSPERFSFSLDDTPMTHILFGDPYSPSPSTVPPRLPDPTRGAWMPSMLRTWRHAEGRRVPEVGQSSSTTPVSPVTGETPDDTITLLIARSHRHDLQLQQVGREFTTVPNLEFFHQIHHGLQSLTDGHHNLRNHYEHLEGRTVSDMGRFAHRIDQMERRMDRYGEMLEGIRDMMGEIRDSMRRPTREGSGSRSEHQ